MEKLPILRADFPEFDWKTESEIASAADKVLAYTAATTKGQCADFHRSVWNEMVVLFSEALEETGLKWNEEYATYIGTCILVQYGALTAQKFNSFRLNLDTIAPTGWKWVFQRNIEGYTGRKNFFGVTERGSDADTLYGWYMVEMARKLNLTLRIMKNKADFSEFISSLQSISKTDADGIALPSAQIFVHHAAKSLMNANGIALPSSPMGVSHSGISRTDALLYPAPSRAISLGEITKTAEKADLIVKKSKIFSYENNVHSFSIAAMDIWKVLGAGANQKIKSLYFGEMDLWELLHIAFFSKSKSIDFADLNVGKAGKLAAKERILSIDVADAVCLPSMHLEGVPEIIKSKEKADAAFVPSASVKWQHISKSAYNKIALFAAQAINGESKEQILSRYQADAFVAVSVPFSIEGKSKTGIFADTKMPLSAPFEHRSITKTMNEAEVIAIETAPIKCDDVSVSAEKADIKAVEVKAITARGSASSILYAETRQVKTWLIEAKENAGSVSSAEIDTAWYPPIRRGNTLHIIQAYDTERIGNRLKVI